MPSIRSNPSQRQVKVFIRLEFRPAGVAVSTSIMVLGAVPE
jgi:hypothetical protein